MKPKDLRYPFTCVGKLYFSSLSLGEKTSPKAQREGSEATPNNRLAPINHSGKKGKEVKVTGKRDLERKKKNYLFMLIQKNKKERDLEVCLVLCEGSGQGEVGSLFS